MDLMLQPHQASHFSFNMSCFLIPSPLHMLLPLPGSPLLAPRILLHPTKPCSPFRSLLCIACPVKPLLVTLPPTLVLSCCGPQHMHYISFPVQPGGSLSTGTVFPHHTSRIPVQSLASSKCSMHVCWVSTTERSMLAAFVPFLRITPLGLVTT